MRLYNETLLEALKACQKVYASPEKYDQEDIIDKMGPLAWNIYNQLKDELALTPMTEDEFKLAGFDEKLNFITDLQEKVEEKDNEELDIDDDLKNDIEDFVNDVEEIDKTNKKKRKRAEDEDEEKQKKNDKENTANNSAQTFYASGTAEEVAAKVEKWLKEHPDDTIYFTPEGKTPEEKAENLKKYKASLKDLPAEQKKNIVIVGENGELTNYNSHTWSPPPPKQNDELTKKASQTYQIKSELEKTKEKKIQPTGNGRKNKEDEEEDNDIDVAYRKLN